MNDRGSPGNPSAPPSTEGQRLLQARTESLRVLATATGLSTAALSRARAGVTVPALQARAQLETLGIPRDAWDRPAGSTAPASSAPPSTATTTLARLDALVGQLEAELAGKLAPAARARTSDALTRALGVRARIEREAATFEADVVKRAPFFRRSVVALLAALRPFPDAARAVAEHFERIEIAGGVLAVDVAELARS